VKHVGRDGDAKPPAAVGKPDGAGRSAKALGRGIPQSSQLGAAAKTPPGLTRTKRTGQPGRRVGPPPTAGVAGTAKRAERTQSPATKRTQRQASSPKTKERQTPPDSKGLPPNPRGLKQEDTPAQAAPDSRVKEAKEPGKGKP
jgi:hypothetical protein